MMPAMIQGCSCIMVLWLEVQMYAFLSVWFSTGGGGGFSLHKLQTCSSHQYNRDVVVQTVQPHCVPFRSISCAQQDLLLMIRQAQ
jgi:hypothetical protein